MAITRTSGIVVVLCGGGVSKASVEGPRPGTSFQGVPIEQIGTAACWERQPSLVRAWFDSRRIDTTVEMPNPAHEALARMQHALGVKRCTLVTWTVDGLLQKASAEDVVELRGSLFRLRCDRDPSHARTGVYGPQTRLTCSCGGALRPDVAWRGEELLGLDRIRDALARADVLLAVGASGPILTRILVMCPEIETIEVNPVPSGERFGEIIADAAEVALPNLVSRWLGEGA